MKTGRLAGVAISQAALEKHLWEAAELLIGTMDSSEFRTYIFALLFFKRICDQEDAARHYELPDGHRWADVAKQGKGIGERLNAAFRAIEKANRSLRGIFAAINFSEQRKLGDRELARLVAHFSELNLNNANLETDALGMAYEFLLDRFASEGGKTSGEFYTPPAVVQLMAECLELREWQSVYDPTCGSGGILLESLRTLERMGGDSGTLSLSGQERNPNTWALCQMNLFLHGITDAEISQGDTIRAPGHLDKDGGLSRFDRVIANPPFSLRDWGHELWRGGDPYGRDAYGCPPANCGDFGFILHMLASLKEDGRLAVVVPHGVLFREGHEGAIRQALIEADLIDGVIGLPPKVFYATEIRAAVLILRKQKPEQRRGKVVIVNGDRQYTERKRQNHMNLHHIQRLRDAFLGGNPVPELAAVPTLGELADADFSLNVSSFAHTMPPAEAIDVGAEIENLRRRIAQSHESDQQMDARFQQLRWVPPGSRCE